MLSVPDKSISDYLIDHSSFDWETLLADWRSILPESCTVWLMNRFGDLFLIAADGSILQLDVGMGSVEKVADNQGHFADQCEKPENVSDWLMIPLVDELVEAGITLIEGQCYTYRTLPIVDGDYSVENTTVIDIDRHLTGIGAIQAKVRDLPNGSLVDVGWCPE
jgi:hypothetical protein